MRLNFGRASRSSGDSLRLPGAETNGAITLQFRSQKATTLSPLTCLCPLKPMLSPPFFAAVVVLSPRYQGDPRDEASTLFPRRSRRNSHPPPTGERRARRWYGEPPCDL